MATQLNHPPLKNKTISLVKESFLDMATSLNSNSLKRKKIRQHHLMPFQKKNQDMKKK